MRSPESAERKRAYNKAYCRVYRKTHPRSPLTPHSLAVKMEYERTRRVKNRAADQAYSKAYRETRKAQIAAVRAAQYKKDRATPEGRARLRARVNRSNAMLRERIFAAYGQVCSCCGEMNREFLTLDHVNLDGHRHRRLRKDGSRLPKRATSLRVYRAVQREGFPLDRYRLLCMNCNHATRYGKKCPHQQAVDNLLASLDVVGVR